MSASTAAGLRRRAQRIIREIEQISLDAEHWSRLRREEAIDPDGELDALLGVARRVREGVGK